MNLPPSILQEFTNHDFYKNSLFGRKVNFENMQNVPECGLFAYSNEPTQFISVPANEDFEVLELPIEGVLALVDDNEGYEIHSERWFKVRKQLSEENETHYPWVYVDVENDVVKLMDGRHRLIALWKFKNMRTVPVQVQPSMVERVKQHFNLV